MELEVSATAANIESEREPSSERRALQMPVVSTPASPLTATVIRFVLIMLSLLVAPVIFQPLRGVGIAVLAVVATAYTAVWTVRTVHLVRSTTAHR